MGRNTRTALLHLWREKWGEVQAEDPPIVALDETGS